MPSDQPVTPATQVGVLAVSSGLPEGFRAPASAPGHLPTRASEGVAWAQSSHRSWSLCSDYDRFAAQLRELHGLEILNSTLKHIQDS